MGQKIGGTLVRAVFSIVLLFLFARLMGKKQISQLSLFDYVCGISFGSVAAEFAVDPSIPYLDGILATIVYGLFPIVLSLLSLRSLFWRKVLDGKPTIVIQKGKIIEGNLRKTRLTINDLLEECRIQGVYLLSEVEYGILETSGKLSILRTAATQPLTPADMGMQPKDKGILTNLIVDTEFMQGNLAVLRLDTNWLANQLRQTFGTDPTGVLLCSIDANGNLFVDRKQEDPPVTPLM